MESLAWTLLGYSTLLLGFVGLLVAFAAKTPARRFCTDTLLDCRHNFRNKLGRN